MVGLAYYRIYEGLSKQKLAEMTELSIATINKYEHYALIENGMCCVWMKFSDCLHISVEELLRTDLPDLEDPTDLRKVGKTSGTVNLNNPIAIYRDQERISFQKLAERLHVPHKECARQICVREMPKRKYLETLARYEHITMNEFIRRYHKTTTKEIDRK